MTNPAPEPHDVDANAVCPNEDHPRPVRAVARVTFPDGCYKPTLSCAGCRELMFREAMAEARPILIEPIPDAHGQCPRCHATVPRRMNGALRAHSAYGQPCDGQAPARATVDVALPETDQ
jgi:hypothetical protein